MDRPPRFVIEPSEAESMAKQSGFSSVLSLLPSLVGSSQTLSRPPISSFPVAAVALASDNRIFIGVNLEFPGLPLHHSVHAEQFLAANLALHHRHNRIRFIAVSAAPCGHCRQFLQEIRGAPGIGIFITSQQSSPGSLILKQRLQWYRNDDVASPDILHTSKQSSPESLVLKQQFQSYRGDDELGVTSVTRELSAVDFKPLSQFLPDRFGPDDLLDKEEPFLLDPHDNGLVLGIEKSDLFGGSSRNVVSELVMAALAAANESHAPYSGCGSGVVLVDCEGKVYKGSYIESAAYNPSLGPVQAALVAYIVGSGGGGYDKIVAGTLVEKEGAMVVQEHTARLLLKLVCPTCDFRVVNCKAASNACKKLPSS